MERNYLNIVLVISLVLLFGCISGLIILGSSGVYIQKTTYTTASTVKTIEIPQDKIKLSSYDQNSDQKIGVLITAKDMDQASKLLESKGAVVKKNAIGNVIAANIPQDQINSIVQDSSISSILPNRVVQAFDMPEAKEVYADKLWSQGYTGKNAVVAILDTGLSSSSVIAEKDFTGSSTAADENGHGTKVANIVLGMAPDAKIINAKVLDSNGKGSEAGVIAGINYAVENGANVISLSLGGLFDDINSPLVTAVEDAISKGVIVVAAAGNCGPCSTTCSGFIGVATPGNAPDAITVGSVNGNDEVCTSGGQQYSNYIKPDVVAPGLATSISTPYVSGAAALLMQKYSASPLQIKSLIENNAVDLGAKGKDTRFGSGKLNLNFINTEIPAAEQTQANSNNYQQEETTRQASTENNIEAFDLSTTFTSINPTWSVVNAWPRSEFLDTEKADFDVYDDNFIIITGDLAANRSSVLIWNGTTWQGNNVSNMSTYDFVERMNHVAIYNRSFAVIGGTDNYGDDGITYVWNGTALIRRVVLSNGVDKGIAAVFANSPTDAYALDNDGSIFRWDGSQWLNFSLPNGDPAYEVTYAPSVINQNSLMLGYACPLRIYYFDGSSWTNTAIDASINTSAICNAPLKIKLFKQNLAYAIINSSILKYDGVSWKVVYSSPVHLEDFAFVDENFGFAAADNLTMIKWNGYSWSPKQYSSMNDTIYHMGGDDTFTNINLISKTEGYSESSYASGGIMGSNWKFDGTDWKSETRNVTYPYPSILLNESKVICDIVDIPNGWNNTLRLSPWKVIKRNGETYSLAFCGTDPSNSGAVSALVKMKKSLTFSVPAQYVNGTADIDLSSYAASNRTVSFSINSTINVGTCSIIGTNLHVVLGSSFSGMGICRVTASTSDQSKTVDVEILNGTAPAGLDLGITPDRIRFDAVGEPLINFTARGTAATTRVDMQYIELNQNQIVNSWTESKVFDTSKGYTEYTVPVNIARGNDFELVLDYDNKYNETSETNNKARATYKKYDVFINITAQPEFSDAIKTYLTLGLTDYNLISSSAGAENILNVGYNLGDNKIGCRNGNVYEGGAIETYPYTGVIFSSKAGNVTTTSVCGARIEGLVAALRLFDNNLENNKVVMINKSNQGALQTNDFFQKKKSWTADTVNQALYGGLEQNEYAVRASDGTWLRLREYKPVLSQNFMDYLFAVQPTANTMEPVVMAGGLWSDINAWNDAAKEISIGYNNPMFGQQQITYPPRDVWEIELTGGPGQECDNCIDYTYNDVVDKYWPALVGAVAKFTNHWPLAYVGHSNGGRVALDAMSNWSLLGKQNAGFLSDGTAYNLPANVIDTYVGVGVPGALDVATGFTSDLKKNNNGLNAISAFTNQNEYHIRLAEVGAKINTLRGWLVKKFKATDDEKISLNLFKDYVNFMTTTSDQMPGNGITIPKFTLIYGDSEDNGVSDGVVPINDINGIYNQITSSNKTTIETKVVHWSQSENSQIKSKIKERVN